MRAAKARDGWSSSSSGLEREFSERYRPSKGSQAVTRDVSSADNLGLAGVTFSLYHCAGNPPPATKFCDLFVTNPTSTPAGMGPLPRTCSGSWVGKGGGVCAVRGADSELSADCISGGGAGQGGLITKNRDPMSGSKRFNMTDVLVGESCLSSPRSLGSFSLKGLSF